MKRIPDILLWLVLAMPAVALAQTTSPPLPDATWALTALAGSEPLRMEGYRTSVALDLTLPEGWMPAADGELTLEYRISELVFAQASLTIRLNKRTIASSLFPARSGTLSFALPRGLIQPRQNVLELEALLPLEGDMACFVPDHPARWVELGSESRLRLPVETVDTLLVLADFPAQFEALGNVGDRLVTFILPDDADNNELSALAAVAFALQRASATHPSWNVVSASDYQPAGLPGPAVLIGAAGRIEYLDWLSPEDPFPSPWLRLARPEWSGGQLVLGVGGIDSQAVLGAASALLDPVALVQMNTDIAEIDLPPNRAIRSPAEETMLSDLGYGARLVRGTGERSLIYSFDLPFEWSPADARLVAHLAHGALLDPDVAMVTILLNGSTALDIRLDAPEAIPHRVEMALPRGLLRPGRNYLRFSFDLGTAVSSCGVDTEDTPWALVRPETVLTVPHSRNGGRTDLADFPEMFGSEVDLAQLIVVLPAHSTEADLSEALRLVRRLSLRANASLSAPRLVRTESVTPDLLSSHVVLLGEAQRQPLLDDLDNYLPVGFDRETGLPQVPHGIHIPTGTPDLGIIQLLRSPWEKNRLILATTGTSEQGYREAVSLLVAPSPQPGLVGDVVVLSVGGDAMGPRIYSRSIGDVGAVPVIGTADRILGRFLDANGPGPALVLVLLCLFLLAIPVSLARSRRGRPPTQDSGSDHGAD